MADDPADLLARARAGRPVGAGPAPHARRAGRPRRRGRSVASPTRPAARPTPSASPGRPARASPRSRTPCSARSAGDDVAVAVLAIDPSSPFSGGAILGDRVRMGDHATDDGVFIRSMATRGHLGGLSLATMEAVRVLDAAGWPWVLIETVGVGPGRGGGGRRRRHHRRGREPGLGRRRAGQQGRPARDRRRLRDQQGRPARRRGHPPRPRAHARPHRRRLGGGRPCSRRRPPRAMASPSCGRRSVGTARTSRPPASSSRGAPLASGTSWSASSPRSCTSERWSAGGPELDDLAGAVARRTIDPWSAAEQLLQE